MSMKSCPISCIEYTIEIGQYFLNIKYIRPLSLAVLTIGLDSEKPELRIRIEIDQIQDPRVKSDTGSDSTKKQYNDTNPV